MAVLVLAWHPGKAGATTADGALITNLASATYKTTAGASQSISYGATVNVMVATPVVMLRKTASATMQASGGTVTFCISFSNAGARASVFNLVITDAMPDNMRFVAGLTSLPDGTAEGWGYIYPAWSTNGGTNWTNGSYPSAAQGGPLLLRWTVDVLNQKESGIVCYSVSVL